MENKNQKFAGALKKLAQEMETPVFTEEEINVFRKSGMTEAEIKELAETSVLADTINVLPDDEEGLNKLAAVLKSLETGTATQKLEKIQALAEKDPKMFAQVMALTTIIEQEVLADAE